MQAKLHVKKGDLIKVIAGDSKGQEGKILSIDRVKNRAIVEGINLVSKHTKPNAKSPQGGIVKQEASVHISNLKLIETGAGKTTTRVSSKKTKEVTK
jgi:large subunit ribosomal protein L24